MAITRWKLPVSGNWNAATNWTDGLPDTNKVAVIDLSGDYTVTLSTLSPSVAGLVLGGGAGVQRLAINSRTLTSLGNAVIRTNAELAFTNSTFNGNGNLIVSGTFLSSAGTVSGAGAMVVSPEGLLDCANSEPSLNRNVHNFGTLSWRTAGRVFTATDVVFYNRRNARVNVVTDFLWSGGLFENDGTVFKKSGTNTTTFSTTFRNNGRVVIEQGTVSFSSQGQHNGIFEVFAPGTLSFANAQELGTNSTIFGAGNFRSSSTVNVRGTYDLAGSNSVTSGTLTYHAGSHVRFGAQPVTINGTINLSSGEPITMSSLTILNGVLTGSDHLTITNAFTFNGGNMSGSGSTTVTTNGTILFASSEANMMRVINNFGTAKWLTTGRLWADNGTFNNRAGATFEVYTDNLWINGVFNNAGLFVKKAGTNTTTFSSAQFNNSGVVDVQSGTLALSNGGTNTAQFLISTNANLSLTGGTHDMKSTASIIGAGNFRMGSSTLYFSGIYDVGGSNIFSGGTTYLQSGAAMNFRSGIVRIGGTVNFDTGTSQILGQLESARGVIRGADNITITNALLSSDIDLSGTGILTIQPGANLDFLTDEASISKVIENRGTTRWITSGRILWNSGGTFNNRAGGLLEIRSDNLWNIGVINNEGVIIKTAGTNTTTFSSATITNRGTINVLSGTLLFSSSSFNAETGTQFGGSSTLKFSGGTFRLFTNINFGTLNVLFSSPPTFSGNFSMANNVGGAMTFSTTATIPGSLNIGGTLTNSFSAATLAINGTLTLQVTGIIDNPGIIKAGAFNNLGGTLTPGSHAIQVTGLRSADLKIVEINPVDQSSSFAGKPQGDPATPKEVVLSWRGASGQVFAVELSSDLVNWSRASAVVREVAAGDYRATVTVGGANNYFFRTKTAP